MTFPPWKTHGPYYYCFYRELELRHSFASAAVSAGLTLNQIGELLGHKSTQTTSRYAHLMTEAANVAANATADKIAMMRPKAKEDTTKQD
jgi:integrase